MARKKKVGWYIDELLKLFQDLEMAKINEIIAFFKKNEELRLEGYGWKRVRVRCDQYKCQWKGKRVWGTNMFKKPCPRCKTIFPSGKNTLFGLSTGTRK